MTTVSIYAAHPIMARGLESIVSSDFSVAGVFSSMPAFWEHVENARPCVAIVEANAFHPISTSTPPGAAVRTTELVMWVDMVSMEFVARCLSSGVRGVISRFAPESAYCRCVEEVAKGKVWIDQTFHAGLESPRYIRLTRRESQIVSLLVQGLRNKEIAEKLGVTEGTVKVYMSKLFEKTGVSDRFELALIALRNLAAPGGANPTDQDPPGSASAEFTFGNIIWMPQKKEASEKNAMTRPPVVDTDAIAAPAHQ